MSSASPLVSVLVTTFNQPAALAELLESLGRQTFREFEVVLVNDAGDSVRAVVDAYPELAIHLIEREVNGGQTACLNVGLAHVRGEYVMLSDHDDFIEPGHLARMVEAIEDADLVYADAEIFTYEWQGATRVPTGREVLAHHFDFGMLSQFLTFTPSGTLYRRTLHETIGTFDPELPWCYWDWDFILRVADRFRVKRVPVASVCYAFSGSNNSADHHKMRPLLEYLMRKHGLSDLKTTNFALMTNDPELGPVKANTLRVWDGLALESRIAKATPGPLPASTGTTPG